MRDPSSLLSSAIALLLSLAQYCRVLNLQADRKFLPGFERFPSIAHYYYYHYYRHYYLDTGRFAAPSVKYRVISSFLFNLTT